MPCSAVATVRARLVTGLEETAKTIFARREGVLTHAMLVSRLLNEAGVAPSRHDVYGDQIAWRYPSGYVRAFADGRFEVAFRDPAVTAKVEAVLRAYGGLLAQAKAKAALGSLGKITSEQRLPSGAVVLNLEV